MLFKMKTLKGIFLSMLGFILVLLMVSCTEKLDVKLENNQPRLVVEGMVTNEASVKKIRLTTTTDYFYTQVAPAVTQAKVMLFNEILSTILIETPTNSGIYQTPANYIGVPGKKYTLTIELHTALNGQKVFSASEVMPNAYKPDSAKMIFHADYGKKGFWETQLFIQDPPEVNYYSFRGYRNDTLVNDTLSKVRTSDDKFYNDRYVKGMPTLFWNQEDKWERINTGDKITLQVGSLTKDYYTFLEQLRIEVEPKNPLFSGPSANISTNISNGGVGYFSVCAVGYVSTIVKK
jgi:hypothetical protein